MKDGHDWYDNRPERGLGPTQNVWTVYVITTMLIFQSKAKGEKFYVVKSHIFKTLKCKNACKGIKNQEFHAPFWSNIYAALKFTLSVSGIEFPFQQQVYHRPEWNVEFSFPNMSLDQNSPHFLV